MSRQSTDNLSLTLTANALESMNNVRAVNNVDKMLVGDDARSPLVMGQHSWLKTQLNVLVLVLAAVSCVMVPLQMAFLQLFDTDNWLIYFATVDVIFLLELLSGFFTSYTDQATEVEIRDLRKTAHNYLRTWFTLDLCSSVPIALIRAFQGGSGDASSRDDGGSSSQQLNKMLRLFKLFKLLRVMRACRLTDTFDTFPVIDSPFLRLPLVLLVLLYYMHFAACMLLFANGPPPRGIGFDAPADQYAWAMARAVALTLGSSGFSAEDVAEDAAAHDTPAACRPRCGAKRSLSSTNAGTRTATSSSGTACCATRRNGSRPSCSSSPNVSCSQRPSSSRSVARPVGGARSCSKCSRGCA
jgi:hypothetical protein